MVFDLKKVLLLFICSCYFNSLFSQNVTTDSSATFVGYWKEGDEQLFKVDISKEKFKNRSLVSRDTISYPVRMRILESTEEGYLIEWKYIGFNPMAIIKSSPVETSGTAVSSIIYWTDNTGAFKELVNWKEIKSSIEHQLAKMLERNPSAQMKAMMDQMASLYSDREKIEAIAIREVQLYHSPFGAEYIVGRKFKVESQLPNVFGGEPFPAVLTAELIDINKFENSATLAVTQELDRVKATQIIADLVRQIAGPGPEENNITTLDIYDVNRFVIQLNSGWLREVYFQRIVHAADLKNVDTMEIELIK